ncbi:MAG TPA: ABC transporter permease [Gemmatimonadaceae bacterium]|nr:ABC transporter permease [Gemmatimonadaceae bacterium]
MLATFFSLANLVNVALSVAIVGIMSVGTTAVILTGGIDLSVGSVVALSGVVAALAAHALEPTLGGAGATLVATGIAIIVGVATGGITATAVAWLRIPLFLVTLALLTICRGLAFLFSDGRSIGDLPTQFGWLGQGKLLGLPVPILVMLVIVATGWLVLTRTTWGRWVYAVGGNEQAAWLAGVPTRAVTACVYITNGALVGIAGIVLASRLGAGVPNAGLQYELDVIAAVVIGGTALTGGRGSVLGSLIGAVCIGALSNAMNLADIDPAMQRVVSGVVIMGAVIAERARTLIAAQH